MGTLVCFHAHPDDEAISTGGTCARAAAEGHRVVLVVATDGAHGESPDDLAVDELLSHRRWAEVQRSAAALGIARVEWLGYADSGMTGWEQNAHPEAFVNAPLDLAAAKLAAILAEERADALIVYDWHGVYGHPDHVHVHRVGHLAAQRAGMPRVWEVTVNRDAFAAAFPDFDPEAPADDGNPFGTPAAEIAWQVDVSAFVAAKREALAAHASQASDITMLLGLPDTALGVEWYCEQGRSGPPRDGWLW